MAYNYPTIPNNSITPAMLSAAASPVGLVNPKVYSRFASANVSCYDIITDGSFLYVAVAAVVYKMDPATATASATYTAGGTITSMVRIGSYLFVRYPNSIVRLDLPTLANPTTVATDAQDSAQMVTDGTYLYFGKRLPGVIPGVGCIATDGTVISTTSAGYSDLSPNHFVVVNSKLYVLGSGSGNTRARVLRFDLGAAMGTGGGSILLHGSMSAPDGSVPLVLSGTKVAWVGGSNWAVLDLTLNNEAFLRAKTDMAFTTETSGSFTAAYLDANGRAVFYNTNDYGWVGFDMSDGWPISGMKTGNGLGSGSANGLVPIFGTGPTLAGKRWFMAWNATPHLLSVPA